MNMKKAWLHAMAAVLASGAMGAASAQDIPAESVEAFARAFQDALSRRDVPQLTRMMKFPLAVATEGGPRRRLGAREFAADFDKVFPEGVTREVLAQDPKQLLQNDQGVAFGNGVVWASEFCNGEKRPNCNLLVITVNRPAAPR